MKVAVEISMYPLTNDYEKPILAFIDRLSAYDGLEVKVTDLSTQVHGDYDVLMDCMKKEMKRSFEEGGSTVMVYKVVHVADEE